MTMFPSAKLAVALHVVDLAFEMHISRRLLLLLHVDLFDVVVRSRGSCIWAIEDLFDLFEGTATGLRCDWYQLLIRVSRQSKHAHLREEIINDDDHDGDQAAVKDVVFPGEGV
jgi:hypothetical protein